MFNIRGSRYGGDEIWTARLSNISGPTVNYDFEGQSESYVHQTRASVMFQCHCEVNAFAYRSTCKILMEEGKQLTNA